MADEHGEGAETMRLTRLVPAILWLSLSSLMSSAVMAQDETHQPSNSPTMSEGLPAAEGTDEFQRTIVFYNDLPFTVWPVIQTGQSSNCANLFSDSIDAPSPRTPGIGWVLMRIHVNWQDPANPGARDLGIPSRKSVTVTIPKTLTGPNAKGATTFCDVGAFYNAARIPVLAAKAKDFEQTLIDRGQFNQVTTDGTNTRGGKNWWKRYPYAKLPTQICGGTTPDDDPCWIGWSEAAYALDSPAQLLEYTIVSQNATGAANPNPNDNSPGSRSFLDFDVSYVDEAYLPSSMAPAEGRSQYMGTNLDFTAFQKQLLDFTATPLNTAKPPATWPLWGPYVPRNFSQPAGKTAFADALIANGVGNSPRIPSAAQAIDNSRFGSLSPFFAASHDPNSGITTLCIDPDKKHNLECSIIQGKTPTDQCCPAGANGMQGCCDELNFQIEGVAKAFNLNTKQSKFSGVALTELTRRLTKWKLLNCETTTPDSPVDPPGGTPDFCKAFKRTVNFVWKEFERQNTETKLCDSGKGDNMDECIAALILGFQINTDEKKRFENSCKPPGSDPCPAGNCCPDCPPFCHKEKLLNESVQALMRGLPWTSNGPSTGAPAGFDCGVEACPANRGGDPSACDPKQCIWVGPDKTSPNAKLYHFDGFLHFWPPYESEYNLNPYARVVHTPGSRTWVGNPPPGLNAPGAYSFSIDDFYGNFGGPGSTLVVAFGKPTLNTVPNDTRMPNPEPYDPYQQYFVNVGPGWLTIDLCGTKVSIPQQNGEGVSFATPFSFWTAGGKRIPEPCVVTVTDKDGLFVKYAVSEVGTNLANLGKTPYPVTDTYIRAGNRFVSRVQSVRGLSGVAAIRRPNQDPGFNAFCLAERDKDTAHAAPKSKCTGNLSAVGFGNRNAYNGVVPDAACIERLDDATCGRPLGALSVPARKPD
jgi:hypothetical protein